LLPADLECVFPKMNIHGIDIGNGYPVVFQHGLASNSIQIQNLLGGLHEFRLLSFDCPGHGKSLLDENVIPSFDHYTDRIIAELDKKSIPKVIFGGLSMGAGIAINAALRYPNYVSTLIVHRPAWLDKARPPNLEILLRALPYLTIENGQYNFEQTKSFKELNKSLPLAADSLLGIFNSNQQDSLHRVIQLMVMDSFCETIEKLNRIRIPILIIANYDDPLHPFSIAENIHMNTNSSKLESVISRYIDPKKHKEQVQNLITNFIKPIIT